MRLTNKLQYKNYTVGTHKKTNKKQTFGSDESNTERKMRTVEVETKKLILFLLKKVSVLKNQILNPKKTSVIHLFLSVNTLECSLNIEQLYYIFAKQSGTVQRSAGSCSVTVSE